MNPPCCGSLPSTIFILLLALASLNSTTSTTSESCFNSIISFGDSLADTGNKLHLSISAKTPSHVGFPPYGETFFRHPTGRFSDGRVVIDFIAEHFGLPFVPPYFWEDGRKKHEFGEGVNYAVGGATALDYSYLVERRIINPTTNVSLGTQLIWFKEMFKNNACHTSSDCKKVLQNSLVLMGEIGGNDICYAFFQGKTKQEAQSLFVPIINSISLAVNELIELGAVTIVVPGNLPIGCLTAFLAYFSGSDKQDYDRSTGCITWLNNFSENYNQQLQAELNRIRGLHPHATIIYADYYNAALQMFTSPGKYGFTRAFTVCCGAGGPYNYNASLECGFPPTTSCEDPSSYVDWDGIHMTEAANRVIANGLLGGPFCIPDISNICSSRFIINGGLAEC